MRLACGKKVSALVRFLPLRVRGSYTCCTERNLPTAGIDTAVLSVQVAPSARRRLPQCTLAVSTSEALKRMNMQGRRGSTLIILIVTGGKEG
jgi:hypothetical protein